MGVSRTYTPPPKAHWGGVCSGNEQKMCAKRWKWVKQGDNPKKAYPQFIKTYYQTTMMPKVPQRMDFYYGQMPK